MVSHLGYFNELHDCLRLCAILSSRMKVGVARTEMLRQRDSRAHLVYGTPPYP